MKSKYIIFAFLLLMGTASLNAQMVTVNVGITQAPVLVASAGADVSLCVGDTLILGGSPSASGGTAPLTYDWAPVFNLSSSSAANPQAWPAGSVDYILTVSDTQHCSKQDTVHVNVAQYPVAAFSAVVNGLTGNFTDQSVNAASWSWDFGDGSTSTQQSPSHTYAASGNYVVCLEILNAENCGDSACQNLSFTVGISGADKEASFTVYPNPAKGDFSVDWSGISGEWNLRLSDITGKILQEKSGISSGGNERVAFSAEGFSSGLYFIQLETEYGKWLRKMELK